MKAGKEVEHFENRLGFCAAHNSAIQLTDAVVPSTESDMLAFILMIVVH